MDHVQHSRGMNLFAAVFGVWLALGALPLAWVSPQTAILGLALLAFVAVMALADLFRYASWIGLAAALVTYGAVQIALLGITPDLALPVGVGALVLVGAAILGELTARRIRKAERQLVHDQALIEDLRIHDPKTGLVRLPYARQNLRVEIARSQRYKMDLSLLVAEVANWNTLAAERGMLGTEELRAQLAGYLLDVTRQVDTCFANGKLGAILPQTKPEGACVVAERLVASVNRRMQLDLYVGIAHFPDDAVAEEELIQAAEAALQVALASGRQVVFYNHVHGALQEQVQD